MSDRLWGAALPNTLLEPLVHPSRQITATIYLFHKRWAVEVWTGWFVVHENATFCPKKEKKEKEMIQALWWKTLAGPDGASNYLHYQNKAITPSGQVRVPPRVIVLTSDPAGKKKWLCCHGGGSWSDGCWSSGKQSDESLMIGGGRREETAECR